MSENQEAYPHKHGLVEHIYYKRVSAQKVEGKDPALEKCLFAKPFYNSPKEISEDVDEDPRNQREVVGRVEAVVGESDERGVFELI